MVFSDIWSIETVGKRVWAFFLSSYINNTKISPLPLSVSFHLPFLTLFYCLDEVPSFIFYIFCWFFWLNLDSVFHPNSPCSTSLWNKSSLTAYSNTRYPKLIPANFFFFLNFLEWSYGIFSGWRQGAPSDVSREGWWAQSDGSLRGFSLSSWCQSFPYPWFSTYKFGAHVEPLMIPTAPAPMLPSPLFWSLTGSPPVTHWLEFIYFLVETPSALLYLLWSSTSFFLNHVYSSIMWLGLRKEKGEPVYAQVYITAPKTLNRVLKCRTLLKGLS